MYRSPPLPVDTMTRASSHYIGMHSLTVQLANIRSLSFRNPNQARSSAQAQQCLLDPWFLRLLLLLHGFATPSRLCAEIEDAPTLVQHLKAAAAASVSFRCECHGLATPMPLCRTSWRSHRRTTTGHTTDRSAEPAGRPPGRIHGAPPTERSTDMRPRSPGSEP